ncbi:hypothetical protein ACROYT_G008063 [Oculina patagonica]
MSRHSPAGVGTSPSAIPIVNVNQGGLEQTLDRIDPIVLRRYLDQLPSPAVGTGTLRSTTPASSRSNVPAGQGTLTGGPHRLNQDDMQRQLQMLFNDQRQVAAGRRIAGITTTNTITTTYKDGGRPTVRHVDRDDDRTMRRKKRVTQRRRRAGRRRIGQKGGILPLAALIPALIAGGKAIALGAASGAAGWGAKKALDAATRKKKR